MTLNTPEFKCYFCPYRLSCCGIEVHRAAIDCDYITKTNFVEFEDDHYQEAAARNALLLLVSLLKSESWMP